ncbi:thiamine ABC transporter permease [Vibrio sp. 10N.286.49.B3]|uniref:ABC transporter permease n=1 Tax=Vibrio sp. 10N.286.49.B3 TaxID=1880855 RepID=UPI000C858DAA|nr:ABC transporter permease subunit [Vibrio sp. 10N.286.49.B3]PMH46694.1 thiamine ABC transporter permease [Vibrio sp. 10N.286.49.B3]
MLRLGYLLVIIVCITPTIPGLLGVLASAFSYAPVLGLNQPSVAAFWQVFTWSGVEKSILISLFSALGSTYLACLMTFAILQSCWHRRQWRWIENSLAPLLAMPHVAFAIGFTFLFSSTGIIARLLATFIDHNHPIFNQAGADLVVNDPYALGLTLVLAMKEVPFLLLMSIPILQQLNIDKTRQVCASLGYSTSQMWWKCLLPQWLNKIRFPLFAVIAYGVSVVDLSLIVGPTNPPSFAVLVWQWFNEPNLSLLPRAAAGAIILLGLASLLLLTIVLIELAIKYYLGRWFYAGRSGVNLPGRSLFTIIASIILAIIPLMLIWSIAQRWRFPDVLPSQYSAKFWIFEWTNILPTISDSLILALISGFCALLLAMISHEYRLRYQLKLPVYIIALPILVPQLSILFGLQAMTFYLSSEHYIFWVYWAHIFFAFPFVYLTLEGPWQSFNDNYIKAALSLGKSPLQAFLTIKAPLLLPAIFYAWAIGISVSLAQYLPTLMLGAGRIATITTEAVALSSGFDRRITAIYALWQAFLPVFFFALALCLSRWQRRIPCQSNTKNTRQHELLSQQSHHH